MLGVILGFKVQTLKILPFGFIVSFRINTVNYNQKILKANLLALKKVIVAFSGPLINLIILLIFFFSSNEEIFNVKKDLLIYCNVLIFLFNMLPIYPLDGGRILKNLFYIFFGKINSLKITNIVSNVMAIFLSVVTLIIIICYNNFSYLFVLMYIWIITIKENKIYKMKLKIYKILKNNLAIKQD